MRLPVVSGLACVKALARLGFRPVRVHGSHQYLAHEDGRVASVPLHPELRKGTLLGILRRAGVSREDFLRALH